MAIDQVIEQAADKIIKAVETYGPQASSLVIEAGRLAAFQNLVTAFLDLAFGIAVAVVLSRYAFRWYARAKQIVKDKGESYMEDEEVKFYVFSCVGAVGVAIGTLFALVGFFNLFDVWSWSGLSHPEIYLAAKLLKL